MRAQRLVRCSVATVGVTTLLVAGLATTAQAETTRTPSVAVTRIPASAWCSAAP